MRVSYARGIYTRGTGRPKPPAMERFTSLRGMGLSPVMMPLRKVSCWDCEGYMMNSRTDLKSRSINVF